MNRVFWRRVCRGKDPNDEPASVLLDQIKAERAKEGTGKKKQKLLDEMDKAG